LEITAKVFMKARDPRSKGSSGRLNLLEWSDLG
jgi:hypothetical protein